MKKLLIIGISVSTIILTSSAMTLAADAPSKKTAPTAPVALDSGVKGKASLFGQYVLPSGSINGDGGDYCDFVNDDFDTGELCQNAFGFAGYAAVEAKINSSFSLMSDMSVDYHAETDSDSSNNDESAFYGAIGLHAISHYNGSNIGAFGVLGSASTLEDEDTAGPVGGGGLEFQRSNYFVQLGGIYGLVEDEDSVIDNLYFVRTGMNFKIGSGVLDVSGAYGFGDFDGSDGGGEESGHSQWAQLATKFEAPLARNLNWSVGYQGDWVEVDDTPDSNRHSAMFHAIKLGISIPFGGSDTTFSTPNFRAPVVAADHVN